MKKWLLGLVLLVSVGAIAQPANYIHDRVRKRMPAGMFDSTLHVPRFNGSPSLRTGGSTNDGAIAIDTANGVFYFYHNSSWKRANLDTSNAFITSVYRKTASDSVFYVKGGTHTFAFIDSTGGGSTPTLQQVLTAGAVMTGNNEIDINGHDFNFIDNTGGGTFAVDMNGTSGSIGFSAANTGDAQSSISIIKDSIIIRPHKGQLNIDSLRSWSGISDTTYKKVMTWDTRNGRWEYSNWFGGSGGSATVSLSSITAATANNSIDNGGYNQTWSYNTISSGSGLLIGSNTSQASGNNLRLFRVNLNGANINSSETTYASYVENGKSGTSSTNVGAYISATSGTNNYAIIVPSGGGSVGIGTSSPASILHTVGTVRHATLGTASGDTTTNKPVGINSSGDIIPMTYWPGGGGGSGTVNSGTKYRLAYYATTGTAVSEAGAITANRALISDANGVPTHSATTATELGYVSGVTSAIQTQLNTKISGSGTSTQVAYFNGSGSITSSSKFVYNDGSYPSLVLGTTDPLIWFGAASTAYPVIGSSSGLSMYGGSTYQIASIYSYLGGSLIAQFKGNSGSYNTIDLNGLVTSNSTTVLSNTRGNFDVSRTVPYAASGNNYHGFTDQTDFRLGLESFNSFGSFVKIGNNRTNMGHYAAFQAVWAKDSTNQVSDIYDFVSAVSTMTAGTIDSVFRFKVFEMSKSGGTVNVQYGIYIPDLSAAGTNYGAYIEDNVGIGTASPAVKLDVTGEIRASTAGTNANSVVTNAGTQTLTNKRITKRVGTTASTASLTIDSDSYDMYTVTALAANITINNPSGTPTSGQTLIIRLEDNGTGRTISYGADFRAIGVTLPTTTVSGKTIYLGCIWNSTDSKWDVVSVNEEA